MRRLGSFSRKGKSATASTADDATASSALVVHDPMSPNNVHASSSTADARLKEKEKLAAELEAEDIAEVLPIRKPKHIIDGTASGLKLAAGGIIGGAAALVE